MNEYAWLLTYWLFVLAFVAAEYLAGAAREPSAPFKRWPANVGFALLNGAIAAAVPVTTISAAIWAQSNGIGLFNVIAVPLWVTVIGLIAARTLAQYAFHRLAHAWPPLWAVHSVHHSDAHLDVTSGLRFHPLEWLVSTALLVAVSVALGPAPLVLAIYEAVEIFIGLASHTSLRVPERFDRALRVLVVTPSLHRLHHSDDVAETEHNYGALLPHWDMLFGTYLAKPIRAPNQFRVGLDTMHGKPLNNLAWLLEAPFSRANTSRNAAEPADATQVSEAANRSAPSER